MNPISPIVGGQAEPTPAEATAVLQADPVFKDLLSQLMPVPDKPTILQPTDTATEVAPKLDLLLQEPEAQLPFVKSLPEAETNTIPAASPKTKAPRIPHVDALQTPTLNPNPIALVQLTTVACAQPVAASNSSDKPSTTVQNTNVTVTGAFQKESSGTNLKVPVEKECVEPGAVRFSIEPGTTAFTLNERSTSLTPPPAPGEAVPILPALPLPLIGVRSIEVEQQAVQFQSLPLPEEPAASPKAPAVLVKSETEINLNLPRPIGTPNKIEFKEQPTAEPQTENVVLQAVHHEAKSLTVGGPALNFSSGQQNPQEHFDKPAKTSPKYEGHIVAVTNADARETGHGELPPASPVEAPRPVEIPVLPLVQVARRVSIDIGDDDSKLRITIHERAGDVSVRFDTATETLRSDLQSSVGSLIEALRREQVPLANLDFTNALVNDDSNRPREQRQPGKMVRRQAPLAELAISDIEVSRSGHSINIHA